MNMGLQKIMSRPSYYETAGHRNSQYALENVDNPITIHCGCEQNFISRFFPLK